MNTIHKLYNTLHASKNEVTVYFDKKHCLLLNRIGEGGSKAIYTVINIGMNLHINGVSIHDLVIVLPNMDVDTCYGHWFPPENSNIIPMYQLEVDGSNELRKRGLLTANQTLFTIYIKDTNDEFIPINCYVSNNFCKLVNLDLDTNTVKEDSIFVIDIKNFNGKVMKHYSHMWNNYNFNFGVDKIEAGLDLDQENKDCWIASLSKYIDHDIKELYLMNYPRYGDPVNFAIETKNGKHLFRFFGFDLSSKSCYSVIDVNTFKNNLSVMESDDFINYKYRCLRHMIEYIMFSEFQFKYNKFKFSIPEKYVITVMDTVVPDVVQKYNRIQKLEPVRKFLDMHKYNQLIKKMEFESEERKKKLIAVQKSIHENEINQIRLNLELEKELREIQNNEQKDSENNKPNIPEENNKQTGFFGYIYSWFTYFFY